MFYSIALHCTERMQHLLTGFQGDCTHLSVRGCGQGQASITRSATEEGVTTPDVSSYPPCACTSAWMGEQRDNDHLGVEKGIELGSSHSAITRTWV